MNAGDVVGVFKLHRLAGQGASGQVWEAVHVADGRRAAMKLLSIDPALDDAEEWRRRFELEAQTARRLSHPDIVALLDAGDDGPRLWLAYEWLDGVDLAALSAPESRPAAFQALKMGERLARALAYAHDLGIVHRDVKPSNVLIDAPNDRVTLIDFGVARVEDGSHTRTGLFLGTPAYMAPEVLLGADASPASDLYALAVMLFELLSGRRPYEAPSLGQLLRLMASSGAADLRTHRPDLPPACAAVLATALQRDPAHRYPDGRALADALARAAQSLPGGTSVP
jgi:serine/threonine-protein kinase